MLINLPPLSLTEVYQLLLAFDTLAGFFFGCPLAAELGISVIYLKNHNSSQEWAKDLLFTSSEMYSLQVWAGLNHIAGRMFDTPAVDINL